MRVFFKNSWAQADGCTLSKLTRNIFERENPSSRQCHPWQKEWFYLRQPVLIQRSHSVRESDCILIPGCHPDCYSASSELLCSVDRIYREAEALSQKYGKPVLLHGGGRDILDYRRQANIPISNLVYLSTNILDHSAPPNHWGLPFFIPDYHSLYPSLFSGEFPIPEMRPSVGFCGVAAPFGQQRLTKTWLADWIRLGTTYLNTVGIDSCKVANILRTNMKHAYRARLISEFSRSPQIDTDILLRKLGGLVSRQYWREDHHSEYQLSYFRNLASNLYTICCRGTENYSIRLYEAFCCGRIPIITNSSLRLPFSDLIDYRRQCCIIEKRDLHRASEVLLEFHFRNGASVLSRIMKENRQIWRKYLSFTGFYSQLTKKLHSRNTLRPQSVVG